MSIEPRPIPRFIAEPPQEGLPYGRWAETLAKHFNDACSRVESDEPIGSSGTIVWFPERTLAGRTYVPATSITSNGWELFGYVSYTREHEGAAAEDFQASADVTDETAEANPEWEIDLSDAELTPFRGDEGRRGMLTLVWGVALVQGAVAASAELGPDTTDQCTILEERFTLVSLDAYTGDYLDVRLWGADGRELASESLYEDE